MNAPFPRDSNENDFKLNGGYFEPNKDNGKIKEKNKNIFNFSNKNKSKNKKNKSNTSGEQSFKNLLTEENFPNINSVQRKIKKSEKKFV